ncbi:hypothetical protein GH714_031723 [Hevea brasiliensis]|uniref:Uncharacterized protein n=1 Tax=Hevea brasiliensis TaxID=3981 RepID=A0A6A6N9J5_HEVBR|nr:hypothetical protein GH714_031551 [Hevea brasiliensis]KAF2320901.1 hypothetical protein GH714_031723 [Hevea brasiliensis]
MSRRERDARDSDSRRHRSGFDREPSPKRSRRDGKPETERVPSNTNLDVEDHADRDQKHRRRCKMHYLLRLLQHLIPSTMSVVMPRKLVETLVGEQLLSVNGGIQRIGNERAMDKSSSYDSRQRDEKAQAKGGDNVWRHDGFFKMEAEPAPPVRKRPAFREKKFQWTLKMLRKQLVSLETGSS